MAPYDVEMQRIFWTYIFPVGIVIISFKVFRKQYRSVYESVYAYMLDRFGKAYNKTMSHKKEQLFQGLHIMQSNWGRPISVVEIGAGSGTNFQFYPDGCDIICIDPNQQFKTYLENNIEKYPKVNLKEFVIGTAEDMSLIPNESVDAVVCTVVLCSVQDIALCLAEVKRILRKGGRFFYMEHVLAEQKLWIRIIQKLLHPVWHRLFDGCILTRTTWTDIENAGFEKVEHDKFMANIQVPVLKPHIMGVAIK